MYARPGKPELQPSDIQPIVRSVVQLPEPEANRRRLVIKERYSKNAPPVQANPLQLQQVFLNLLLNAFDAMPEGGEVSISADEAISGTLVVSIADTGVGIPPEKTARIFEPFFTTKPSGTGLGLAIVQQIVKAHEAELGVAARLPGRRLRFVSPPQRRRQPHSRYCNESNDTTGLRRQLCS